MPADYSDLVVAANSLPRRRPSGERAQTQDALEREAERFADAATAVSAGAALNAGLQRKCAAVADGSCAAHGTAAGVGARAPSVADVIGSSGEPLDGASRARFEPKLGIGLGDVRVHADSRAAASADSVAAEAYTVGTHIAFAAGAYAPSSRAGQRLIAHELAHVAQQTEGRGLRPPTLARTPKQPRAGAPAKHRSETVFDAVRRAWVVSIDGTPVAEVTGSGPGTDIQVTFDESIEGIYATVIANHDGKARLRALDGALQLRPIVVLFKEIDRSRADAVRKPVPHARQTQWLKDEYAELSRNFDSRSVDEKLAGAADAARQLRRMADSDRYSEVDPAILAQLQARATEIERLLPQLEKARKNNLREQKGSRIGTAISVMGGVVLVGGGPEDLPADTLAIAAFLGVLIFGVGVESTMVMRDPDLPRRQAEALRRLFEPVRIEPYIDTPRRPVPPTRAPGTPVPARPARPTPKTGPEPEPEPGRTIDVAPTPSEPQQRRKSCATEVPERVSCNALPAQYNTSGVDCSQAAARGRARLQASERSPLVWGNQTRADAGPCAGRGGEHRNVMRAGDYMGAIVCCPCCTDTLDGPYKQCQCGFVRKRGSGRTLEPFP